MPESRPDHAEHFQDLATQHRASELGMWVFLASETLLFAGLFALYTAARLVHGEPFVRAASHNDLTVGTAMTVLLLFASFFVAWAVHGVKAGQVRVGAGGLLAAILLGGAFIGLKVYEYHGHVLHGILPGAAYGFAELPGDGARMFFTLYYLLTALHGLHLLVGLVLLAWVLLRLLRGQTTAALVQPLVLVGLYFHLVDVLWLFLWPMLYQG